MPDERTHIREMAESDCQLVADAFAAQGWDKPASQYQSYWQEQQAGKRDVLVAEHRGRFAGYVTIVWWTRSSA